MLTDFILSANHKFDNNRDFKSWQNISVSHTWNLNFKTNEYSIREVRNTVYYIVGDLINPDILDGKISTKEILKKGKGFFYLIIVNPDKVILFSSLFGILPIYYASDHRIISNSLRAIKEYSSYGSDIDKRAILEKFLFNYTFSNRSIYKNILLNNANTSIELLLNNIKFEKQFSFLDFNFEEVRSGKKVLNDLADLFIETTQSYFPKSPFTISFTGGFDGRTLVSCASYLGAGFSTFSFGRKGNDDVDLPREHSRQLNIPYEHIDLGAEDYLAEGFGDSAREFLKYSPDSNGFLYPHFLYSAKLIAQKSDYLIAGYFGSELFRAMHIAGAVTSKSLVDVFSNLDTKNLKTRLQSYLKISVLNEDLFHHDFEELFEEIIEYKHSFLKGLTQNQIFYSYIFEHTFPKLFGQWIYVQSHFLNVRVLFFDYHFISELMKSEFAGVNSPYKTENPFTRLKGQLLYTAIIRKTNQELYHLKTGKGYRPVDVYSPILRSALVIPFLKKKLLKNNLTIDLDNLGLISGFIKKTDDLLKTNYLEEILKKNNLAEIIKSDSFKTNEWERDQMLLLLTLEELNSHEK